MYNDATTGTFSLRMTQAEQHAREVRAGGTRVHLTQKPWYAFRSTERQVLFNQIDNKNFLLLKLLAP